jgi:Fe-S cluster assembly scaffold protein SufB
MKRRLENQRGAVVHLQQRGISPEDAVSLIINGFCKDVFLQLPMEFDGGSAIVGAEARR